MPPRYRFGPVDVRPAERRVLVGGKAAPLGGRAFDVLVALIERRDRLVGKDELLELVWPGLVVEENNLQVQVSTLRRILGPEAIATVSGKGYRFTLEPDTGEEPAPASAERRHNLPAFLTRFIGREREKREVASLLEYTPLVTLTGFGGTGKTRLALEVAAEVAAGYPDGAWLVELAPLAEPRIVPQAVASVLGVREGRAATDSALLDALVAHVRDRRLLLVLDNCEHLAASCARLAKALLQANPRLRILATSREALRLAGEAVYPLAPFAVPDAGTPASAEAVAANDAARLFVDRATAAHPAFRLADGNAGAVAEICRRLDGIPLALELAAARVRALSVEAIASRVNERLKLLDRGDPTALARQQTLRALIDWSHDLLRADERAVLRRLAVFAGSCTVEAAEAVATGGDIEESAVLDLVVSLVEKSLVVREEPAGRYRLLETVREHALEQLEASGEAAAARSRHLAWYLSLAEQASVEVVGPQQAAWLARLDLERENFLAASAWCDRAEGGAALGLRLVRALRRYWVNRGQPGLGLRLVEEALSRPGAQARDLDRCRALFVAGQLGSWMGRYGPAKDHLAESLEIAREIGDGARVEAALQALGNVSLGLGDLRAARHQFEEALALSRKLGNRRELAAALVALAQLDRAQGRPEAAEPHYEEAVGLARELGDRESIAIGLLNLAMVSIDRGATGPAKRQLAEAIEIAAETGSKPVCQSALDVCAGLAAALGKWEEAARFHAMAQAVLEATGLHRDPTDEAFLAPLVAKALGALGPDAFERARASGAGAGYEESLARARSWISRSG